MGHLLYYLKTNKWYKYQKDINIKKEIDICTARFLFNKNEIAYKPNLAGQANAAIKKSAIVK